MKLPRYPIYIPSKGRAAKFLTAKVLMRDDVPFVAVVEPQEAAGYAAVVGTERLLVLPFRDRGSVIPARNFIKDHATAEGHARHWQLDDNLTCFYRTYRGKRIPCRAHLALRITEDFVDRYENIAIAGLNYDFFLGGRSQPFTLNCHVYSCTLVLNSLPHRWRGRYNEDTDICLQVLSDGWCTVLMHAFAVHKKWTMSMSGGNTDALYQGDGRLKMARSLERMWPGVVETQRRFQRPQHMIIAGWRKFDTPLKRRADVDWDALEGTVDDYGMELKQVAPIRSEDLRRFMEQEA